MYSSLDQVSTFQIPKKNKPYILTQIEASSQLPNLRAIGILKQNEAITNNAVPAF